MPNLNPRDLFIRPLLIGGLLAGAITLPTSAQAASVTELPTVPGVVAGPNTHALGLDVNKTRAYLRARLALQAPIALSATLPVTVNLSANAPSVGDQGQVGSCAAWAEDYDLRGYYAKLQGNYPASGFAPMSTYAVFSKGADGGSYMGENASLIVSQGVDTQGDYTQGSFDYTSQPTAAELANAAHYKIARWTSVQTDKVTLETLLAQGTPVAIGIEVHPGFDRANATNYLIQPVTSGDYMRGGHEIAAFGYTDQGVLILNSWGTSWGNAGWGILSWDYVARYVLGGVIEVPLSGPVSTNTPSPALTSTPTPIITPTATATLRPTMTAAPTLRPTVTATATTRPTATTIIRPTMTATPTTRSTATATAQPTATPTMTPIVRPTASPAPGARSHVSIVSTSAYGPVAPGGALGVATFILADQDTAAEAIDISMLGPNGQRVYEGLQVVPLSRGTPRGVAVIWSVPRTASPGRYTVAVTVSSTKNRMPSTVDASNTTAATFIVTASKSTKSTSGTKTNTVRHGRR